MQDIYTLLMWVILGAIAMRIKYMFSPHEKKAEVSELDNLVSYVIASVPVYGGVKIFGEIVETFEVERFSQTAVFNKGWFVASSWPLAVFMGWVLAKIEQWWLR